MFLDISNMLQECVEWNMLSVNAGKNENAHWKFVTAQLIVNAKKTFFTTIVFIVSSKKYIINSRLVIYFGNKICLDLLRFGSKTDEILIEKLGFTRNQISSI